MGKYQDNNSDIIYIYIYIQDKLAYMTWHFAMQMQMCYLKLP
uniref:Uncharacterized protein n=1 Tax=Heterorhabditis bacteriophora TaxID=37862 RepID=A0A1I7WGX8_HETBA